MKKGKEALKELYNFRGFSFGDICKQNSVLIYIKKKGKTGICPVCNRKRRKVIEIKSRKVRDMNINKEKCFIVFDAYRIKCKCGYRSMEKLDFVLPNEMITKRFADQIFGLCEKMSITDAAKFSMVNWRTAKRIDKKKAERNIQRPKKDKAN